MPKAVIFDVDGTLIDTVDLHAAAWVEAFRHFGIETRYEDVRDQIGKGGDQLMPVFVPQEELKRQGKELETYRSELFKREYLPRARPFPGVRALFERIRGAGGTVALASSCKEDEIEHYKKLADIADLVDAATTSDDAERSKPQPDIFQAALERIKPLTARDAVVVGDTRFDAEAAVKAGIRPIGVLCGGFPEDDLREAGCIAVYRDPEDLLRRYESSPLRVDAP